MAPPVPPKKLKFAPKAPPRRAPKPEVKAEKTEEEDAERAAKLMQQFQERSLRKNKVEKKAQASQIAFFGKGGSSSIGSYGMTRLRNMDNNEVDAAPSVPRKEYQEPWDYYSYYPVTLPMRRPYSGNPATLDEQEFGGAGEDNSYNESVPSAAEDLNLLEPEENAEPTMMFIQLPNTMPMPKKPSGKEGKGNSSRSRNAGVKLEELPAGLMGKMLVYRSGKVKLKLGDTLYDVCAGMESTFAQDVVAVNTAAKQCCAVAEVDKRAILIPDIEAITTNMDNL
ncbi:DNA-directed RNA polymerase III subunit RPC4 [Linum grandiflorum]